ncbi:MAG: glucose-6-phosphate isomerase family protein, partial [Fimbriimonadales bacterium]
GEAVVRFRHIDTGARVDVRVSGEDLRPIDIPPGYTHCIENVGDRDLVTLFWASEPFDPNRPDTIFEEVGP